MICNATAMPRLACTTRQLDERSGSSRKKGETKKKRKRKNKKEEEEKEKCVWNRNDVSVKVTEDQAIGLFITLVHLLYRLETIIN